jgi:hypothetical protein
MKKLLLFAPALLLFSFKLTDTKLTKEERAGAVKLLMDTEKGVFDQVKGLSDAQLQFKPAADRWSVEECVKHIAVTEQALWKMTDSIIRQTATPDQRSEVKTTDQQIVQMIENRTQKFKTMDPFKPENTPYKSTTDALASFKANRAKLVAYVKTTQEDLRDHIATMPFGKLDSYQMILFIAAHSNRHTQQIEEVKADPGFPKN